MIVSKGWEFVNCHVWDKGLSHIAGNVNTKTIAHRGIDVISKGRGGTSDIDWATQGRICISWARKDRDLNIAHVFTKGRAVELAH